MSNDELISKAYEAMKNSYAPYSKFNVGAVALCGERCAIFKAVSDGCTKIDKIVIVCSTHDFAYPCGICRQVMTEFMDENGIIVVTNDKEIREYKLSDLIPESFRM